MIALLERRTARAIWDAGAERAQPGEVWTARYATDRAVTGGRFESWTAGPVRQHGDECPVEAYRGQVALGEFTLRPGLSRWMRALDLIWPTYSPTNYVLVSGDAAPVVRSGSGADLLAVTPGSPVMVEHRSPSTVYAGLGCHPVYAELRCVEYGAAGEVIDFGDGDGPGRYVGDSWVQLGEVTGVQTGARP